MITYQQAIRKEFDARGIWYSAGVPIRFSAFAAFVSATRRTVDFVIKDRKGDRVVIEIDGVSVSLTAKRAYTDALRREGYQVVRVSKASPLDVRAFVDMLQDVYAPMSREAANRRVSAELEAVKSAVSGESQPS